MGLLLPTFHNRIPLMCADHIQKMSTDESFRLTNGLLLFRGTLTSAELRHELRLGRALWHGDQSVHQGFYDLYSSVRENVFREMCDTPPHTIAGHSLGGVFAILAARDMADRIGPPERVITFGCPRVGDRRFRKSTLSCVPNIIRVVNDNDVITRLPPFCRHVDHVTLHFSTHRGALANHALPTYYEAMRINDFRTTVAEASSTRAWP